MMVLAEMKRGEGARIAVLFNRTRAGVMFTPPLRPFFAWQDGLTQNKNGAHVDVAPRSVVFLEEVPVKPQAA